MDRSHIELRDERQERHSAKSHKIKSMVLRTPYMIYSRDTAAMSLHAQELASHMGVEANSPDASALMSQMLRNITRPGARVLD